MAKYRKRTPVVEAEQFLPSPEARDGDLYTMFGQPWRIVVDAAEERGPYLEIDTFFGTMKVFYWMWVVRNEIGQHVVVDHATFHQQYALVS